MSSRVARSQAPTSLPSGPFASIRETLQSEALVADHVFDDVYPFWARRKSSMHWTPVVVAARAAKLLAEKPGARLLDIGSGVGKFCIVAAATVAARVSGIEHRAHLVEVATSAAARVGVDVSFRHGTLTDCDPREFDGIYLYNPFTENICSSEDHIDGTVELSEARYAEDVTATEDFLRAARVGTRVVTYCGFGRDLPPGYTCVLRERHGGSLELWVKTEGRQHPVAPSSNTRLGARTISALVDRVLSRRAGRRSR